MNINSKIGDTLVGGQDLENSSHAINANQAEQPRIGNSPGGEFISNSNLRKSIPGSTSGLRQLHSSANPTKLSMIQQQKYNPPNQGRQSHSHSSQAHGQHTQEQVLNNNSSGQQYHSVVAQPRHQQIQPIGLLANSKAAGSSNVANSQGFGNQNAVTNQQANIPISVQNAASVKYPTNSILGVSNHSAAQMAHKQFSMSSQQGLFPKIGNVRDHASIPNSAHSQKGAPVQPQQPNTMNVLKNSGGHISGMSHHNAHQHNLNQPNDKSILNPKENSPGFNYAVNHSQNYIPNQSPRMTHPVANPASESPQIDPNVLYQQQLKWKTQLQLNANKDMIQNKILLEGKQSSIQPNGQIFSPGLIASAQLQAQLNLHREKQISSSSEKRLKLNQQRQYYSEQYRAQQQKQHQQTANAVLTLNAQNSQPQSMNNTQTTTEMTQNLGVQIPFRMQIGSTQDMTTSKDLHTNQIKSADYMNTNTINGKLAKNMIMQAPNQQLYSQQLYNQHKFRSGVAIQGLAQSQAGTQLTSHSANTFCHTMPHPNQQHLQSMVMMQHDSYQQQQNNNGVVFLNQRASSNNITQPPEEQTSPIQPTQTENYLNSTGKEKRAFSPNDNSLSKVEAQPNGLQSADKVTQPQISQQNQANLTEIQKS